MADREAALLKLHADLCEEYDLKENGERAPILEALNDAYNLGCQRGAEIAKAEAQPAGTGWVSVEERPLEDGETRIMAVRILRNGVPDWDIFVATPECGEWADECNDPGWDVDEVTHSRSLDLNGLPPLPPPPEPRE